MTETILKCNVEVGGDNHQWAPLLVTVTNLITEAQYKARSYFAFQSTREQLHRKNQSCTPRGGIRSDCGSTPLWIKPAYSLMTKLLVATQQGAWRHLIPCNTTNPTHRFYQHVIDTIVHSARPLKSSYQQSITHMITVLSNRPLHLPLFSQIHTLYVTTLHITIYIRTIRVYCAV